MNRWLEVRSFNLKPGTRAEFHRLFVERAYALLRRWQFDVVGYGPSAHDRDSYYVIRSFDSLQDREQREDAYYASDDWRQGPREAILALVDSYTDILLEVDDATLHSLKRLQVHPVE